MTAACRVPAKWKPKKRQILKAYGDGLKVAVIREKFGLSYYMLYRILEAEGVALRSDEMSRRRTGALPCPRRPR
ncbi:hypothetical protein Strvi_0467 [Streptomyces violaceusniger Tu 4113]|uniref:Uncharacterized protein n=1 Tax=Streptomyces violaceusniger (strain Tu 4113) TaxID=653045 RepID=G2P9V4_STRV4|nr:hypothetical protein Strvi_0467 [Streptomyces violaceusniger Tu 4113]